MLYSCEVPAHDRDERAEHQHFVESGRPVDRCRQQGARWLDVSVLTCNSRFAEGRDDHYRREAVEDSEGAQIQHSCAISLSFGIESD